MQIPIYERKALKRKHCQVRKMKTASSSMEVHYEHCIVIFYELGDSETQSCFSEQLRAQSSMLRMCVRSRFGIWTACRLHCLRPAARHTARPASCVSRRTSWQMDAISLFTYRTISSVTPSGRASSSTARMCRTA